MQRTLAQAVDMHQFIRCQIARGIHCSTEHADYHHCSTSRRGEEPSAVLVRILGFAPSYYSTLHHSLQGAIHYDAFLSMHFHHQRDFGRVWFNAELIRVW